MNKLALTLAVVCFATASQANFGSLTGNVNSTTPSFRTVSTNNLFLAPNHTSAINKRSSFEQGTMVASLGIGVPNLGRAIFKAQEDLYPDNEANASGIGPLFAKFEYGVSDKIGVGVVLRLMNNSLEINDIDGFQYDENGFPDGDTTYNYKYTSKHFAALIRMNYHFANSKTVDPYVGLAVGYGNTNREADFGGDAGAAEVSWSSLIPLGTEFTIGMRYYFSDQIGAYGEVGLSKSIANFGLSIKI